MTVSSPANFADPTRQLLRRFGRRRRQLLAIRSLAAGVAVLLVAMVAVSLVDRLAESGETWRLILSCLAYGMALTAAWLAGLGQLVRRDDPAAIALMLETAEPRLRDQLVAAVEFSGRGDHGTSDAFRAQVIHDAADQAGGVNVERLLAWRRIRPWATAAGTVVAIILALVLLAQDWQLGRMLSRALLPTASIDPASRFTVAFDRGVDEPLWQVPRGEAQSVSVNIGRRFGDREPDRVWLEIDNGGDTSVVPLTQDPSAQGQYTGRARFDEDARIIARADAARTAPLQVETRLRPELIAITRQITPPTYLVNRVDTPEPTEAETGDIEALADSTARLTLQANQPLSDVQVELLTTAREPAGTAAVAISPDEPDVAQVSFPLDFNGYWRVRLTAASTAMTEADPPLWTVRARSDAPPQIDLEQPASRDQSHRSLSLEGVIETRAIAVDDVGLAHLRRDVRVNGGEWQTRLFEAEPGEPVREMRLPEAVDVASLTTEVGDRLEMRLLATDLRGNETAMELGQWTISGHAPDPVLVQRQAQRQQLAEATRQLREAAERFSLAAQTATGTHGFDALALRQQRLTATQRLSELQRAADELWRTLLWLAPETIGERDNRDIARLGESLLRLRRQLIPDAIAALGEDEHASVADAESILELATSTHEVADRMRRSDGWAAASATSASLLSDLRHGIDQFEPQQRQLGDSEATARLRRRLVALTSRTAGLLATIDDATADLTWRSPETNALEQARASLDRADEQLRRGLRNSVVDHSLEGAVSRYERALERVADTTLSAAIALEAYLESARSELDSEVNFAASPLRDPAAVVEELMLAERSSRPDPAWLADLGGAKAVLQDDTADIVGVGEALTILRQDARLRRLSANRDLLKTQRQSAVDRGRALLESSGEWKRIAEALRGLAGASGSIDSTPLANAARLLRASRVPREFARQGRIAVADDQGELHAPVMRANEELREAREVLAPAVQAARARLADPSQRLADRLAELARTTRAEAEVTEDLSAQPVVSAEELDEVARRHDDLSPALDTVLEDLRQDGLRQDLMTEEGRQRARDADDAQLLLRRDRDAVQEAVRGLASVTGANRAESLAAAAEAHLQLGDDLEMLARHWRGREAGAQATADSREHLRNVEAEEGVQDALNDQYGQMEELVQLQDLDEADRLAALEAHLKTNEKLRQELERLAAEAARQGQDQLETAARDGSDVAEALARAEAEIAETAESMRGRLPEVAQRARALAKQSVEPLAQGSPSEPEADAGNALHSAAEAADLGDAAKAAEELAEAVRRLREAQRERDAAARSAFAEAGEVADEAVRDGLRNAKEASERVDALRGSGEEEKDAAQALATAAQEANALRREAQASSVADDAAQAAQMTATAAAAEAQEPIREATQQAAASLARASRHQERLENDSQSAALSDAAASASAAAGAVDRAQQAAQRSESPAEAMASAKAAARRLGEAADHAGQANGNQAEGSVSDDAVARGLAQLLDSLDRESSQGAPSPQQAAGPGQAAPEETGSQMASGETGGAPSSAAERLAEAQAQAIRQQRLGRVPRASRAGGATGAVLNGMAERPVTGIAPSGDGGDWDKLPSLETTDLTRGAREDAPPEYRDLVDAYYRRLAERSRDRMNTSN